MPVEERRSSAPRAVPALQGRDPEVSVLREAIDRAQRGIGDAVVIEGVAGIGKTRLAEMLLTEARERGFETFASSAEELEREQPMSAVFRALRSVLADIEGPMDRATPEDVLDVIEARALRRPVLLCIEDLHWADSATLIFVRAALRRAEGLPMLVVATTRPPLASAELAHTLERIASAGVRFLELAPLAPDAIGALVADVIGASPGRELAREIDRASGTPFYILELVHALNEAGVLRLSAGVAELTEPTFPPSLRVTVLRRLAVLPTDTHEALRTGAMLGSTFALRDLATATGRPATELMGTLAPALAAGFLQEREERLAFRHDLVRSALYDDIPSTTRRGVHRSIGAAFAEAGYGAPVVATHMGLGAEVGDREAIGWLIRAADEVSWTNFAIHGELLQRADALCPPDDERLPLLRARIVGALGMTGRGEEALAIGWPLLSLPLAPDVEYEARYCIGHALQRLGRVAEAQEQFEILVESPQTGDEDRAAALADLAAVRFGTGNLDGSRAAATEAVSLPMTDHVHGATAGHMILAHLADAAGDVGAALEHATASARASDIEFANKRGIPPALVPLGISLFAADRHLEALEQLHLGRRRAEDGELSDARQYQQVLTAIRYQLGEWDEAIGPAGITDEWDVSDSAVIIARASMGFINLRRGDVDAARSLVMRCEEAMALGASPIGVDLLATVKALMIERESSTEEAVNVLSAVWAFTGIMRYLGGTWRHVAPELVRLAVDAGRDDVVADVLEVARHGAKQAGGVGTVEAAAMRIEGLASGEADPIVAAAEHLRSTARVVETADTVRDAALALARSSDDRAPAFFAEALERYEGLGAAGDVDRLRSEMRPFGLRAGTRGTRKRPTTGWEALTPSELRVVELVAQGLTNAAIGDRLFISRRTAQTHLRSVFDKLGVKSRAEVAAISARRSGSTQQPS